MHCGVIVFRMKPDPAPAGKSAAAGLKPLPLPRLKPLSAEKLEAFQRKYSPAAKGRGVDGVATVLRLRRGAV
jgi:hypothetical protein